MIGLGAAGFGAYIGFGSQGMTVSLPAGLPAMEPETVAVLMFVCGAIAMLLGAISIHRANDYV
ncbi:hypothetical protein GXW74_27125 [Roseomonas eburnea]|uniref:Uncharacterized protein n=1 Tax=Neoroseomonas eburnea TaxID=1346889 RepID=A0A9X9XKD1_9PROT|nr:hypothetical protein [Neoroseomonas eburnea]MBR0684167.1 hypothetical protein [Neoroseomonas eburnea]